MTRIGVIADSHVGEYIDRLPDEVFTALAGCDRIIHAGDITRGWVLDELAAIAPVTAVLGDHDRPSELGLGRVAVVDVDGIRIGVTHGRRRYWIEAVVTLVTVLSRGHLRWNAGFVRALLRRTGPVDVLIHGHWHVPVHRRVGSTVVFCPGALCPLGSLAGDLPPRRGIGGLVDRAVRSYRRLHGPAALVPAVGIIEVADGVPDIRRVPIGAAETM